MRLPLILLRRGPRTARFRTSPVVASASRQQPQRARPSPERPVQMTDGVPRMTSPVQGEQQGVHQPT